MKTKQGETTFNFGLSILIAGTIGLFLTFIFPFVAVPFLILTFIFSLIHMRTKFKFYAKIGLALSVTGFVSLFVVGLVFPDLDSYFLEDSGKASLDSVICEDLEEVQCLEYSEYCQICTESITSSYASCHSIKFCDKTAMFDPGMMATEYVKTMPEFQKNNGRNLKVTGSFKGKCPGCYTVELGFLMDSLKSPGVNDNVDVIVTINDWEIVDVINSFSSASDEIMRENELIFSDPIVVDKKLPLPENVMTVSECESAGGEVFNTLGESSYKGEMIGRIDELNCPCVCLAK